MIFFDCLTFPTKVINTHAGMAQGGRPRGMRHGQVGSVRRSIRCGDLDVQAMKEAGTESVEWARQELTRAGLHDKRLDWRLVKDAE